MATLNAVVDISHHNGKVDFVKAKAAGIIGVIQKATQGTTYVDPTYASNKAAALKAGLLWGAYHFGTGSDPSSQAQAFLRVVGDPKGILLALDFEPNTTPGGTTMNLDQARAFLNYVSDKTGKRPGLYGGSLIKQLLGNTKDPVLAKSWLWLAQYGPTPVVPANWATWTFWQYTDGTVGPQPHAVNGIGNCDRDQFNGAESQLRALWT